MSIPQRKTGPHFNPLVAARSKASQSTKQLLKYTDEPDINQKLVASIRHEYYNPSVDEIKTHKRGKSELRTPEPYQKVPSSNDLKSNNLKQINWSPNSLNSLCYPPAQLHPKDREGCHNSSPSLNNVYQELVKKHMESMHTQSYGILSPYKVKPQNSCIPDVSKTHYRIDAWKSIRFNTNNFNDTTFSNHPSIDEELNRERYFLLKKSAAKNIVGKIPHSPGRVFSITKDPLRVTRNTFVRGTISGETSPSPENKNDTTIQGRNKKVTMLNVVQGRAAESLSKALQGTKNPKSSHVKILAMLTGLERSVSSKSITLRQAKEELSMRYESPKERVISIQDQGNTMSQSNISLGPAALNFKKAELPQSETSLKKKDFKITKGFESNFYMARIEKEALKKVKVKKPKIEPVITKERTVVVEDLVASPVYLKSSKPKHPLFDKDDHDRNEPSSLVNPVKKTKASQIRRRLVKSLNKMKMFKLTPKDLLINEKIFSTVPYEKPGSKNLIAAAKVGDQTGVELTLAKYGKFLVYDFDHVHQTALHWASRRNYPNIAEVLLKNGADVNAKDLAGRTALYFAIKFKNYAVLRILLAYRADPWSTKDCDYRELCQEDVIARLYLTRARQLQIVMKMTPASLRESLWQAEGGRMFLSLRFGLEDTEEDGK